MNENLKLYVEVHIDTEKLQRKLRAIAKHLEALADELEQIEKEEER